METRWCQPCYIKNFSLSSGLRVLPIFLSCMPTKPVEFKFKFWYQNGWDRQKIHLSLAKSARPLLWKRFHTHTQKKKRSATSCGWRMDYTGLQNFTDGGWDVPIYDMDNYPLCYKGWLDRCIAAQMCSFRKKLKAHVYIGYITFTVHVIKVMSIIGLRPSSPVHIYVLKPKPAWPHDVQMLVPRIRMELSHFTPVPFNKTSTIHNKIPCLSMPPRSCFLIWRRHQQDDINSLFFPKLFQITAEK